MAHLALSAGPTIALTGADHPVFVIGMLRQLKMRYAI
jgi:hypothetical protein